MAREFAATSHRVALLESGGLQWEERSQALNEGKIIGRPYYALTQAWLRYFGGTTNHWTAYVRPLDPIDFEERPWVPQSGWPITREGLDSFYTRAAQFLKLAETPFDPTAWIDAGKRLPWEFEGDRVKSDVIQIVAPENRLLGIRLRQELEASENIDTYLYANVVEIVPDKAVKEVRHLAIATDNGNHQVTARYYVLAAGGIENPRLLLLSTSVQTEGLGNGYDLVGRYFSNHIEVQRIATFSPSTSSADPGFYLPREHANGTMRGCLALDSRSQKESKLLNARFIMNPHKGEGWMSMVKLLQGASRRRVPEGLERHIANVIADIDDVAAHAFAYVRPERFRHRPVALSACAEQIPNAESRVLLDDQERDRFDRRRVVLDWRFTDEDVASIRQSLDHLVRHCSASGLGRIRELVPNEDYSAVDFRGSYHHMGTTRMHPDARQGVVDANCRVHGISNLFVAGSSVFPTYGHANPTFTIIALAMRLSDHLRGQLQ